MLTIPSWGHTWTTHIQKFINFFLRYIYKLVEGNFPGSIYISVTCYILCYPVICYVMLLCYIHFCIFFVTCLFIWLHSKLKYTEAWIFCARLPPGGSLVQVLVERRCFLVEMVFFSNSRCLLISDGSLQVWFWYKRHDCTLPVGW